MKTQNAAKDVPAGCRCIMYGKDNRHWPCPIHGKDIMNAPSATPLKYWINAMHDGNITHAAKALGVDRSTLHRVMNSGCVINGTLYTIKRKSK